MSEYLIEVRDRVATLTLNRPATRNALTVAQLQAMAPRIEALYGDPEARVLVVTGAEGAFSSGADLMANAGSMQAGPEGAATALAAFHAMLRAVWNFSGPTLAVIPGVAVGFGFDLALACDLRVASASARFSQSFARIALVPDGGSSLTLQRLVGSAKAYELMYLAELFGAAEALEMGLINRVVPDAELGEHARALAVRLAAGPPRAYRLMKANMRAALGFSMEDALDNEAAAQLQCLGAPDMMAGVAAWMSKTTPEFSDR